MLNLRMLSLWTWLFSIVIVTPGVSSAPFSLSSRPQLELPGDFKCPPRAAIAPCTCLATSTHSQVRCDGVAELETLQQILTNHFNALEIPLLRIYNGMFVDLPPRAFANITAKRIIVSSSKLRSISDDAFVGLEDLPFLVLAKDALREVPTAALQKLPKLETLSLSGNQISEANKTSFQNLTALKNILLADNQITAFEEGVFSPDVVTIGISGNRLEHLNASVRGLLKLEWLLAARNFFEVLTYPELEGLSSLKLLLLDENQIVDIRPDAFKDLKNLKDLKLAYNRLERIGDFLKPIPQLRYLNLSHNHLTQLTQAEIGHLTQLQILDVSGNALTELGTGIAHMKYLVHLNISRNALTAVTWNDLKWMRELRELDISRNHIKTISGQLDLFPSKVYHLNLADNQLSDIDDTLFTFRALSHLDISNNQLTTLDMRDFAANTKLQRLDISGNPFVCDDKLVATLREFESNMVTIVGIPFCYVSPAIIDTLELR